MRFEYKYLVPDEMLDLIRREIARFAEPDPYMGDEKDYTVRSIYFDNSSFDYYNDKVDGLEIRKKIRIRGYGKGDFNSIIFLEIKKRLGLMLKKFRAKIRYSDFLKVLSGERIDDFIVQDGTILNPVGNAKAFMYYFYRDNLRSTAFVVYEREAFHGKFEPELRITLDKNLRGYAFPQVVELFDERECVLSTPGYFTLEVKTPKNIPEWLRNITSAYELKWMALSKYVLVLDSLGVFERKFIV